MVIRTYIVFAFVLLVSCGRQSTTRSVDPVVGLVEQTCDFPADKAVVEAEILRFAGTNCGSCHGDSNARGGVRLDVIDDPASPLSTKERWSRAIALIDAGTMPPGSPGLAASCGAKTLRIWVEGLRETLDAAPCGNRPSGPLSFTGDVKPIADRYCVSCHSGDSASGHVRLDTEVDLMDTRMPSERWSLAVHRIQDQTMPPTGRAQPSSCEVAVLKDWVRQLREKEEEEEERTVCAAEVQVSARPTQRLSKTEYSNAIRALFGEPLFATLGDRLEAIPGDNAEGGFASMTFTLSPDHILAYFGVANEIRSYYASYPQSLKQLLPCWITETASEECFRNFLATFGTKIFRRPLSIDETNAMVADFYDPTRTTSDILLDTVTYLLQTPTFLYHMEVNGTTTAAAPDVLILDTYARASRLSFLAWASIPDDRLLELARNGTLADPDVYAAEVERVFNDPRTKDGVLSFVTQWFHLDRFIGLNQDGFILNGLSIQGLEEEARREFADFVVKTIVDDRGNYGDLLLSRQVFLRSENIARAYAASGPPNRWTTLPDESRRGVLTRLSMLLSPGLHTAPIRRGAFVLRSMLCEPVGLPDPNAFPPDAFKPPPLDPSQSTRQRWETKTSPTPCRGCHGKINPIGFTLESFDTLGRFRVEENIFNDNGTRVNHLPIDAQSSLNLDASDEATKINGPVDLSRALAQSKKAQECAVKQWFRYSNGRVDTSSDRCAIVRFSDMRKKREAPLLEVFKDTALRPDFTRRKIPQ